MKSEPTTPEYSCGKSCLGAVRAIRESCHRLTHREQLVCSALYPARPPPGLRHCHHNEPALFVQDTWKIHRIMGKSRSAYNRTLLEQGLTRTRTAIGSLKRFLSIGDPSSLLLDEEEFAADNTKSLTVVLHRRSPSRSRSQPFFAGRAIARHPTSARPRSSFKSLTSSKPIFNRTMRCA
jgi:hypothetical protein